MENNTEKLKFITRNNVRNENETRITIEAVLEDISSNISKSVGPYGGGTLIRDIVGEDHTITKDGYTIIKKFKYEDFLAVTILDILKKVSKALVKKVGDGSTSSVIIANAFYKELNDLLKKFNVPKKEILECLEIVQNLVEKHIKQYSKPITNNEELSKIACVSNNNDKKLGNIVSKLYDEIGEDGFIDLNLSPTRDTYYEVKSGYEYDRGFINYLFTNMPDRMTCELKDVKVFLCNDVLQDEDMEFLGDLIGTCFAGKKSILVLAKGYSEGIRNFVLTNKQISLNQQKEFEACFVEYGLKTLENIERFEDLAFYLGGKVFDRANMSPMSQQADFDSFNLIMKEYLGSCEKAIITDTSTKLINGYCIEKEFNDRLSYIDEKLEKCKKVVDQRPDDKKAQEELFNIQKRKSLILCQSAVLYVGGESDIEKKNRKFLLEDSIFACKSALKYGYIIGGNLIIPIILENHHEEIFNEIYNNDNTLISLSENNDMREKVIYSLLESINNSFKYSFEQVLNNRRIDDENKNIVTECINRKSILNLKTNKYEDMNETNIVNSAMTDIEIMKAVFSIIGQLVTCNQFISVGVNNMQR